MGAAVRALRGATTVDEDTVEQINERVQALVVRMLERNDVDKDDLISILFTATDDIHAVFPAAAARAVGLGDVPLICARELDIVNGTPRCIRVMMHLSTTKARDELHHVYLEGAKDTNIPLTTTTGFYAASQPPKWFGLVAGADHYAVIDPTQGRQRVYFATMAAFFDLYLRGDRTAATRLQRIAASGGVALKGVVPCGAPGARC